MINNTRAGVALATTITAAVAGTAVNTSPASATAQCENGIHYRVTARGRQMILAVSPIVFSNNTAAADQGHYAVSRTRTNRTTFSASLQGGVEGSFWKFAKASAQANLGVTLEWSSSYTENVSFDFPIPAHSTVTLRYGWMRVNSYVQQYRFVQTTGSRCAVKVLRGGWVEAPYTRTYSTIQHRL